MADSAQQSKQTVTVTVMQVQLEFQVRTASWRMADGLEVGNFIIVRTQHSMGSESSTLRPWKVQVGTPGCAITRIIASEQR